MHIELKPVVNRHQDAGGAKGKPTGHGAQRANNSQVPTGMRVRQEKKWWRYAPYFGNTESVKWTKLGERASRAVYMHSWRSGTSTRVKPHQILHSGLHSRQSYTSRVYGLYHRHQKQQKQHKTWQCQTVGQTHRHHPPQRSTYRCFS